MSGTNNKKALPLVFLGLFCWYLWSTVRLHSALPVTTLPTPDHASLADKSSSILSSGEIDETEFAACLLVMDDNHFLIEWLAYHYHVLPLRHLIIAVDPRSQTTPKPILDRWKKLEGGNAPMNVELWSDPDFMTFDEKQQAEDHVAKQFKIHQQPNLVVHRARQRLFYYKCMKRFKEQKRHWVALIDSDEFLHINYPTTASHNITSVPPITKAGSVASLVRQLRKQRPYDNRTSTPCIQIPRQRYGTMESPLSDIQKGVPTYTTESHSLLVNASALQTLRWRHHASPDNYQINRISKTIIDVSRVEWDDLQPVVSIHRPIRSLCGQRRLHIRSPDQFFLINHYLGTWEQYSYRQDSRTGKERSREMFAQAQKLDEGCDDEVRPWLQGFVQEVGINEAKRLLEGVGILA